jgi:hypothetical protein
MPKSNKSSPKVAAKSKQLTKAQSQHSNKEIDEEKFHNEEKIDNLASSLSDSNSSSIELNQKNMLEKKCLAFENDYGLSNSLCVSRNWHYLKLDF